jgi:hypothetical protein
LENTPAFFPLELLVADFEFASLLGSLFRLESFEEDEEDEEVDVLEDSDEVRFL